VRKPWTAKAVYVVVDGFPKPHDIATHETCPASNTVLRKDAARMRLPSAFRFAG
jgi:hypothetical protein